MGIAVERPASSYTTEKLGCQSSRQILDNVYLPILPLSVARGQPLTGRRNSSSPIDVAANLCDSEASERDLVTRLSP